MAHQASEAVSEGGGSPWVIVNSNKMSSVVILITFCRHLVNELLSARKGRTPTPAELSASVPLYFFASAFLPPPCRFLPSSLPPSLPPSLPSHDEYFSRVPFRLEIHSFVLCVVEAKRTFYPSPLPPFGLLLAAFTVRARPPAILWPTLPQEQDKYISWSPSSS